MVRTAPHLLHLHPCPPVVPHYFVYILLHDSVVIMTDGCVRAVCKSTPSRLKFPGHVSLALHAVPGICSVKVSCSFCTDSLAASARQWIGWIWTQMRTAVADMSLGGGISTDVSPALLPLVAFLPSISVQVAC